MIPRPLAGARAYILVISTSRAPSWAGPLADTGGPWLVLPPPGSLGPCSQRWAERSFRSLGCLLPFPGNPPGFPLLSRKSASYSPGAEPSFLAECRRSGIPGPLPVRTCLAGLWPSSPGLRLPCLRPPRRARAVLPRPAWIPVLAACILQVRSVQVRSHSPGAFAGRRSG